MQSQGGTLGVSKTIFHKEFTDNVQVVKNILAPWYLAFYTSSRTHYLPDAFYVDRLTAVLAAFGAGSLVISLFVRRFLSHPQFQRFLLLFLLLTIAIGGTSPYSYPPTTRGIHYIPFYIVFAAYGLSVILSFFKKHTMMHYAAYMLVICSVIILNAYHIMKPFPLNTTTQIVMHLKESPEKRFLFVDNCHYNFYNIATISEGYQLRKEITIEGSMPQDACMTQRNIFSCQKIACESTVVKTFDNQVTLFRITRDMH